MSIGHAGGADPSPTFVTVRDPLDHVRLALLGLGAVAQSLRSVALDLGEHLLLLEYDPELDCTSIAVGGADSESTANWLAHQLEDAGCAVTGLLPPRVSATSS
jgi:hypothetical protein